jgi:hypothetical protein
MAAGTASTAAMSQQAILFKDMDLFPLLTRSQ